MKHIKLFIWHIVDWSDDNILHHRFYSICSWCGLGGWGPSGKAD